MIGYRRALSEVAEAPKTTVAMSRFSAVTVLTTAELVAHGLVCPPGGIAACDNAGECGLCLLEVPPSLVSNCPYGKSLPHCRAGNVEFGQFCEASGLQDANYSRTAVGPGYVCGTHKHVNSCFGGFDTYVNVFCAGTPPQRPPPPPSPLPLAPPPPAPALPPGVPPPAVAVSTPTSPILVAACIPAGFLVLFCMALLVYRAIRRRSTARIEQEHHVYQAKLSDVSSEYNSSVLYAVKSIATYAHHGVEMSTVKPANGSEVSDDCAVCMEGFKEGDTIKVLPCHHKVRLPSPGRSSSSLLPSLSLCIPPRSDRPPALMAVPPTLHRHVAAWQGPRATNTFVAPIWAADLPAVQGGADRGPRTGLAPTATRLAHSTRPPDCTRCGGLGLRSLVFGKHLGRPVFIGHLTKSRLPVQRPRTTGGGP